MTPDAPTPHAAAPHAAAPHRGPAPRRSPADAMRAGAFERGLGIVLWTGLLVVLFAKLPF